MSKQATLFYIVMLACLQRRTQSAPTFEVTHSSTLPIGPMEETPFPSLDAPIVNAEDGFQREMEMRSNAIQQRKFPSLDPPEQDGQGTSVADINTYDKFHYEMVPRVSHYRKQSYRMDCGSRFGYNYCSE